MRYYNIRVFLLTYVNPNLYEWCSGLLEKDSEALFECLNAKEGIDTWKYVGIVLNAIFERMLPKLIIDTFSISNSLKSKAIHAYKKDKYGKGYKVGNSLEAISIEYIQDNYEIFKDKLHILPTELYGKIVLCKCKNFKESHFGFMMNAKFNDDLELWRPNTLSKEEIRELGNSKVGKEELGQGTLDIAQLGNSEYFIEINRKIILKKIDGTYYAKCVVFDDDTLGGLGNETREFCNSIGIPIDEDDGDDKTIRYMVMSYYDELRKVFWN